MILDIELTPAEALVFEAIAVSPADWLENAARARIRVAMEEVVVEEVRHLLAAGLPVPATREAIVLGARAAGRLTLAAERAAAAPALP